MIQKTQLVVKHHESILESNVGEARRKERQAHAMKIHKRINNCL